MFNKIKFKVCSTLNLASVYKESTEMPNTLAFTALYRLILSRTAQSSAVQTEEKAKGKNKSKTLFPRYSFKLTCFLSLSYKVKSGAACPICNGISKNIQQASCNKALR